MRVRLRASRFRPVKQILDAILADDTTPDDFANLQVPSTYRGVTVRKDEATMFEGLASHDKDPRKSLHVDEVDVPELGPGEALVAVMASAINYNTVWTSIFEPMSTFGFLERYGRMSPLSARHDLPYHVVGSDLAGVVLRTGPGIHTWKPGDEVVAHCLSVELESPDGHNDTMLDPEQRIWGFETNFGGLAHIALVKSNQLMPKANHLTWEEAASPGLVNSTAYRQLVSRNGAGMKQGDNVLIWGASGGLGGFATQYALNGGATPVCVVSSADKAEICRSMGAELIINRSHDTGEGYRFWKDEHNQDQQEWRRLGAKIRELTGGEDVDIVFEHPGRETFGASVFAARKGGTIVTCASTSGYLHQYDNRYLWMNLKNIVGSHFANYRESWEANRLIAKGMIHPTLSRAYPMDQVGQAALDVHMNAHQGKVGVLCLAPEEGLGVRDAAMREKHLDAINRFRGI
jgi:crotonyl-CoA reductase